MKSIKRPSGTHILVCGCGWPLWVEHLHRVFEGCESVCLDHMPFIVDNRGQDFDGLRLDIWFVEVEWYVTNLQVGIAPDPKIPALPERDYLRVTGKCLSCNAFFDIRNKDVFECNGNVSTAMILL